MKVIKIKAFAMVTAALLLLSSCLIQLGEAAYVGSDRWIETWHSGSYQNYPDYPENISTTTTVYSADYKLWVKIALVVSVYQYQPDVDHDCVNFRVALYFDSFASESLPVPLPEVADSVTFFIDKDTDGSNLNDQLIEFQFSDVRPLSQGYGLVQSNGIYSTPQERRVKALHALATAVCLFAEPLDVALDLTEIASAWSPDLGGGDFDNAGYDDLYAHSYWYDPGYDFGTENPVREYAFNTIKWLQNPDINPATYYGIKVWARVRLHQPNPYELGYIDTSPVYLRIKHYPPPSNGGGGGCPFVSTWNGTDYVLDNNLLPMSEASNETDVVDYYKLQQPLVLDDSGAYRLLLSEFEQEHDFFDQVKLLAVDHQPNVGVAVSLYGEILTYTEPSPPVSAIDDNQKNVKHILSAIEGDYYEGHNGSYITLNFGDELDVSKGTKLVMRADTPLKTPDSIHVQVQGEEGNWNDIASVITRVYWATEIIDLSEHLPDAKGNLKVRLYFTANHKIDFVGLDTSPQATIDIHESQLISAIHSTEGDFTTKLLHSDNTYAELVPEQEIILTFTSPPQTMEDRDCILLAEGHYYTITN